MALKRRTLLKNLCTGAVLVGSGVHRSGLAAHIAHTDNQQAVTPIIHLQTGTALDRLFSLGVAKTRTREIMQPPIGTLTLDPAKLLDANCVEQFFSSLKNHRMIMLL